MRMTGGQNSSQMGMTRGQSNSQVGMTGGQSSSQMRMIGGQSSSQVGIAGPSHRNLRSEVFAITRKYFGKKVTIVEKSTHAARLHQKSKYIKSMGIDLVKYYRSYPCDRLKADSFTSKGGSIILCRDVGIREEYHNKIMLIYRSDDTIFRPPRLNKFWLKRMTSMRRLNLYIRQGWSYTLKLAFDGKSIKSFSLSSQLIQELRDGEFQSEYMQPCVQELLRMSSLTAITLDLRTFKTNFKKELYSFIAKSNLSGWQIRDSVGSRDDLYFKELPKPLQMADFIHFSHYTSEGRGDVEDKRHSIAFEHMAYLRSRSNKKLTLIVQSTKQQSGQSI